MPNPFTVKLYNYTRFNPFYQLIESLLLRMKCEFKHQDWQMFALKLNINKYWYFSPS